MIKPVPREPTQTMLQAGDVAWCEADHNDYVAMCGVIYRAMWDAAPAAQAEPTSDDARDAARLKQRVSEILADALSGRMERYILKHADPAVQFVRWGRVEDDIHAAIDAAMRADK